LRNCELSLAQAQLQLARDIRNHSKYRLLRSCPSFSPRRSAVDIVYVVEESSTKYRLPGEVSRVKKGAETMNRDLLRLILAVPDLDLNLVFNLYVNSSRQSSYKRSGRPLHGQRKGRGSKARKKLENSEETMERSRFLCSAIFKSIRVSLAFYPSAQS